MDIVLVFMDEGRKEHGFIIRVRGYNHILAYAVIVWK